MNRLRGRSPPPWRSDIQAEDSLPEGFFARDVREVARALLGTRLVSTIGGARTVGVIVETEAYLGPEDPASHAATRGGRTARNEAMFGPGGRAYVYRIYGVHWCLNVVTGSSGQAQAVLLRGLEPLEGLSVMRRRRGGASAIASGPGRLCQAFGVDGSMYGHDFERPPLRVLPGWRMADEDVAVTGRIGVRRAVDWPLRFYVEGNPGVSR